MKILLKILFAIILYSSQIQHIKSATFAIILESVTDGLAKYTIVRNSGAASEGIIYETNAVTGAVTLLSDSGATSFIAISDFVAADAEIYADRTLTDSAKSIIKNYMLKASDGTPYNTDYDTICVKGRCNSLTNAAAGITSSVSYDCLVVSKSNTAATLSSHDEYDSNTTDFTMPVNQRCTILSGALSGDSNLVPGANLSNWNAAAVTAVDNCYFFVKANAATTATSDLTSCP